MLNILSRTKIYLKIADDDTLKDSILNILIDDVSSIIENYCGQPILQRGIILKNLLIENSDTVIMPYSVPTALLSIEYAEPFTDSYTTLSDDNYEVYFDGLIQKIWFKNGFNKNLTYKITVAAGFHEDDMPKDILSVATEMVVLKYNESVEGKDILGKSSVASTMSGATVTTVYKDLKPTWKEILNKYKLIYF